MVFVYGDKFVTLLYFSTINSMFNIHIQIIVELVVHIIELSYYTRFNNVYVPFVATLLRNNTLHDCDHFIDSNNIQKT